MIRAKITPSIDAEGFVHVKVEWVRVEDEVPGEVVAAEEFRVNPEKFGSSYFSKADFHGGGKFRESTFYTDPEGLRHFHVSAEVSRVEAPGGEVALKQGQGIV